VAEAAYFWLDSAPGGKTSCRCFPTFPQTQLPARDTGLSWWLLCPLEELIPQKLRG
jgi:hypothetical protein